MVKKISSNWEFAPAKESTDHIKIKKKYELFINGEFVKPQSKKYFNTINPATDELIAKIAEANEKDVNFAVSSARKAFKIWTKLQPKERGKYIFRIARMIQERAKEFALIESIDGFINSLLLKGLIINGAKIAFLGSSIHFYNRAKRRVQNC